MKACSHGKHPFSFCEECNKDINEQIRRNAEFEINGLLGDLRASVRLAANALERDEADIRAEIAKDLRVTFGKVFNKLSK